MNTVIQISSLIDHSEALSELVTKRLNDEFAKGRITGKEYSNVFISGINTAIQQALEFTLQKDQAAAQTDLALKQIENIQSEIEYREKQSVLLDKEIILKELQATQVEEQTKQIQEQTKQTIEQTLLIKEQVAIAKVDLLIKNKQLEQMVFEIEKAKQESLLTGLMKGKTEAETSLLIQKRGTEENQLSVMDKQKELYDAQIQGFSDDDKQKMFKINADMWIAQVMADPNAAPAKPTA